MARQHAAALAQAQSEASDLSHALAAKDAEMADLTAQSDAKITKL